MSDITIYKACVKAGKSEDCCRAINVYERNKLPFFTFISGKVDSVYGANIIESRSGVKKPALSIYDTDNIEEIVRNLNPKPRCIIGDECQFLTIDQCNQLFRIAHDPKINIPVICFLLSGTFQQTYFEGSAQLMSFADYIMDVITICWCGDRARMNARIENGRFVDNGEVIQVSDSDYIPLCGKHYFLKDIGPHAH